MRRQLNAIRWRNLGLTQRLFMVAVGLILFGAAISVVWQGYGLYVMVVADLLAIAVAVTALFIAVYLWQRRRRRRPA